MKGIRKHTKANQEQIRIKLERQKGSSTGYELLNIRARYLKINPAYDRIGLISLTGCMKTRNKSGGSLWPELFQVNRMYLLLNPALFIPNNGSFIPEMVSKDTYQVKLNLKVKMTHGLM
jgi:hypothetical protein